MDTKTDFNLNNIIATLSLHATIGPLQDNWPLFHYVIGISRILPYDRNVTLQTLELFSAYPRLYNSAASPASRLRSAVSLAIIIHQTHYEKSDWSRGFNQCSVACELDMINAIPAADVAFIMSSSVSAWLLSPLQCSPQKQNGWTLLLCLRMNYVKNVY